MKKEKLVTFKTNLIYIIQKDEYCLSCYFLSTKLTIGNWDGTFTKNT